MTPEIALVVSTYQRPAHLRRCLLTIAQQQDVHGRFELVVTDDGSTDETQQVVEEYARAVDFSVQFTTHRHEGFQLARCRNDGCAANRAPYLLFLDGDCLLPPDHVAQHLAHRQHNTVIAGDCLRLGREASERISDKEASCFQFMQCVNPREGKRIALKAMRARIYSLLQIPMRPRLTGNNIGIWRSDLERINGFDENFIGWGLEDRDLQRRLAGMGVRCKTILHKTVTYHLWHPADPTFARNSTGTPNLKYYRRPAVPVRCRNGLTKRIRKDLSVRVVGWPEKSAA